MEIRYLKLVRAIVEEGSMANAIEKLHLTPSALSHQLREAELQLGTKIFHRVNKKLILTEAGEKLLAASHVILKELDKVQREIKEIISGETGVIRISTECYTSYHWLPALLKKFHTEFPSIEVRIVFEATHRPIQKLLQGQIDLAITSDPIVNDQIEYVELFRDEMVALVSEFHPWVLKEYVTAEDFKSENLIIHSEPLDTVTVYERVLKPANIQPKNITILPLTEASVEMVKADMGVLVMPRWALKPHLNSNHVKTVKVTTEGLHRQQFIALLKQEDRPEYFDYFITFLRQEIEM
ncbi:MAG TPA: LysR family transcriptional regulator [Cyclobacteriaceae bacterium]|nr:LysR family transcriptional regulator [Cyclobacteriaceae bacterium]